MKNTRLGRPPRAARGDAGQHSRVQRLLLLLLFELELEDRLDELFEDEFDELLLLPARWLRLSLVRPIALAARCMPRSQPPKKLCTGVSPRGRPLPFVLELLDEFDELFDEELLDELFDELLEELLEELDEEFDDELDELLDEEFPDELPDELEPELPDEPDERPPEPLDELLELELPALNVNGRSPSSACKAMRPMASSGSVSVCAWACAPDVATRPATVVAIMRCFVSMKNS